MVGTSLVLVTVRLKLANEDDALLTSVTVITIAVVVPTSALTGVPVNAPVLVLKLAQLGLLVIL